MEDPFVIDGPERAREARRASEDPTREVPADDRSQGRLARIIHAFREFLTNIVDKFRQELEDARKLWSRGARG